MFRIKEQAYEFLVKVIDKHLHRKPQVMDKKNIE